MESSDIARIIRNTILKERFRELILYSRNEERKSSHFFFFFLWNKDVDDFQKRILMNNGYVIFCFLESVESQKFLIELKIFSFPTIDEPLACIIYAFILNYICLEFYSDYSWYYNVLVFLLNYANSKAKYLLFITFRFSRFRNTEWG